LPAAQKSHLLTGSTHATGYMGPGQAVQTREEFDDLVAMHGGALLKEWMADPKRAGTRPFFWWLARGEERPIVAGYEGPVCREASHARTFGFYHEEAGFNLHGVQESQESYLRRHGLLTAAEKRAIAARPAAMNDDD
jgi:hypothetical protein